MKKSLVGALFLSASLAFAGTTGAVAAGASAGSEATVAVQASADAGTKVEQGAAMHVDHHTQGAAKLDAKAVEVNTKKVEPAGAKAPVKKEETKSGVKKTSGRAVSSVKDSRPAVSATAK